MLLHSVATRIPWGNPIGKFLLVGGGAGLALGAHLVVLGGDSLALLAALLTYAFLCELYLFLFTMVASSISARLLLLLRQRDLTADEIKSLYDPAGMVDCRLERLLVAGLLKQEACSYRVSGRGRRLAALFLALKRFFGHPRELPS